MTYPIRKNINRYIPQKDRLTFLFLVSAGMLNHFLYKWTGSALAAFFCPVNESVWEHLKLLFFPFLFCSLWHYMWKKPDISSFFFFRLLAVLCGMLSVVMLFYTYTGIIGRNFLPLDIIIFITGILVTLRMIPRFTRRISSVPPITVTYMAWLAAVLCFFTFTCFPPELPLFFCYS